MCAQERLSFCMAPVSLRDPRLASALLQFATRYAAKQVVHLDVNERRAPPGSPDELQQMEITHQVCPAGQLPCGHHCERWPQ